MTMYIWPSDLDREIVIAGVNVILAGSWTPEGVLDWWDRPRYQLGGLTPKAYLDINRQMVIDLADSGRESGGT